MVLQARHCIPVPKAAQNLLICWHQMLVANTGFEIDKAETTNK